jgi:hypothetical protein
MAGSEGSDEAALRLINPPAAGTLSRDQSWAYGQACRARRRRSQENPNMHNLIYLIGLIVVILAVLSFFGLR